jgi:hypothetical protein
VTSYERYSTEELIAEVARRGGFGPCPTCHKWQTYIGIWDKDGRTLRCHGCLAAVAKCRCGRGGP